MKSILFSALAIVALASTGCALQSGGSTNLCGQATCAPCTVMSGDCNCSERRQLTPEGGIFANFCDREGMGLCMFERGTACGKKRRPGQNGGSDCGCGGDSGAASCGCDSGATSCGCESNAMALSDDGKCFSGDVHSMGSACDSECGCASAGSESAELVSAPVVEPVAYQQGFGGAFAASATGGIAGRCGTPGCGHGNRFCSGCLSRLAGGCGVGGCGLAGSIPRPGQPPYGGAIPHTAQGPGAGTGTAPSYAYPYYTTRGPRDFLMKNPPSIGY